MAASFLNPCQEDNYYTAQAFLPWGGAVDLADTVLHRASDCRRWDMMPSYFLAFNAFYFRKNYTEAGRYFEMAASRGSDDQRSHLLYMASKFYEKGEDLDFAASVIRELGKNTANPQLKAFLEARAQRVVLLSKLRHAADEYHSRFGRQLSSLEDLVSSGIISEIPEDPLHQGFGLDGNGVVQLRN